MQCSLETETRGGTRPLSVSCEAENIVLAVLIALNKLTFSLETIFMRLKKPTNNFAITKRIKCLAFIPVIQLYV